MIDVNSYSTHIKREADEVLGKTNLIKVLSEYGEVFVGGSYKYNLMWDLDIDLMVKCEDPRKTSMNALQKLIELKLFQKYEYGDFVKFNQENRPESYIVNLRLPYADRKWEIETWFIREVPESQIETDELIKTRLNDDNKKAILEMKKKREESGKTKHSISSLKIYDKVLNDGIKNFEDLFQAENSLIFH